MPRSYLNPIRYLETVVQPGREPLANGRVFPENIETLRYLSAPDATTKYGTGYIGGVIEVTTRRGR